jgi:hypothetical protein
LIPVKDLAKYDKVPMEEEVEEQLDMEEGGLDTDITSKATIKSRGRQLTLVYVIFLAEA